MGTKTKIAGLMVALIALSAPMVYADNGGGDRDSWHHGGDWQHGKEHQIQAEVLNLSDDQQKQLKDSHQKQKDALKAINEQIKANREELDAQIIKATPDMNKVNGIVAQIKTLLSQMVDSRFNSILVIKKIMTPEQFAGYMALEKAEDIMKRDGHGKFDHKDGACKMGDGHKHWGDKADKDHDADDQD